MGRVLVESTQDSVVQPDFDVCDDLVSVSLSTAVNCLDLLCYTGLVSRSACCWVRNAAADLEEAPEA